jgi:hypothetical protein
MTNPNPHGVAKGERQPHKHTGTRLDWILGWWVVDKILATRPDEKVVVEPEKACIYAERLGREIASEHTLVAARMTWNLSLQGFLFAAFALALKNPSSALALRNPSSDGSTVRLDELLHLLPMAGLFTAVLSVVGMLAAFIRINALKRIWYANEGVLEAYGPRPFSTWYGGAMGRLPAGAIGVALIACWWQLLP